MAAHVKLRELDRLTRPAVAQKYDGVLAANLPPGLVLVQPGRHVGRDPDHHVRLDRSERQDRRRARLGRHRADGHVERRVRRGVAVVRELTI